MNSTLITRFAASKLTRADFQGLRLSKYWLALLALVLLVSPKPSFGQATSQLASTDDGGAAQPTPAEITKELEAMKQRIEQLEAELKALKTQPNPAAGAALGSSAPSASPNATLASGVPPAPAATPDFKKVPGSEFPQAEPAKPAKVEPFSDYDWTWLNGNPRTKDIFWDSKFFTPEIRADVDFVHDFNHPADHSMGGSSELFRTEEIQLEQLGVGGDFHFDNVRARLMTQFGMYSATTPRNDPSPGHGQWDLDTAYRYLTEAYGGYHVNVMHGLNVDAGIFLSYIGLFSYYNFDNWAYQPSYVSSNTPWFFEGLRVQIFPTAHLKIEPWFINGWQSYGSANHRPGLGGQIKWTPKPYINIISNNYGLGQDDLFIPGRKRIHTDDSIEIKYFDRPENSLDKMAFSFTGDLGCEYGGGVSCLGTKNGHPKQSFVGYMFYNRFWFHHDLFGLTLGGGQINNPGRYLVLIPPINGAGAISAATSAPYFTGNPGDPFKAWDMQVAADYAPQPYVTFRLEYNHRHANVPYFSGPGGVTPPGGNQGAPGSTVANWDPDLVKDENRMSFALMVKM